MDVSIMLYRAHLSLIKVGSSNSDHLDGVSALQQRLVRGARIEATQYAASPGCTFNDIRCILSAPKIPHQGKNSMLHRHDEFRPYLYSGQSVAGIDRPDKCVLRLDLHDFGDLAHVQLGSCARQGSFAKSACRGKDVGVVPGFLQLRGQ